MKFHIFSILLALSCLLAVSAEQCGRQAGGVVCPNGLCCSEHGWCGSTNDYCGTGCQSQCSPGTTPAPSTPTPTTPSGGGGGDVRSTITPALFDELLKHRNDGVCEGNGFYSYDAFVTAAGSFNGFGTTGDDNTRKRELAAFLAQTSHETRGGGPASADGPYAWGYCFIREVGRGVYCDENPPFNAWPCVSGREYYGRGPIQLTHNYNYGPAGNAPAIGLDLLSNPDTVATHPVVSFKTAIWFWMTPQGNKPSSHDVITGRWTPSDADRSANRVPGYGVITNIINGGLECGHGSDDRVASRIGFYRRYCEIMGVSDENNLDCYNQAPFSS